MPQPPLDVKQYIESPLPPLREQYPPGTGGTGPRADWPEQPLKQVQVIDDFEQQANEWINNKLPSEPIPAHPAHKYPKFVQAITTIPTVLKTPTDLQKSLSTLPLAAISSTLTALEAKKNGINLGPQGARGLDTAGYESDGGEEDRAPVVDDGKTKAWYWQFNKSPLGSGEFLLMQQGSDEVKLVVRTINASAFSPADWAEFDVDGPYSYNVKSKASWYWYRQWAACNRLGCKHFVLTDWQRWAFGSFDDARANGFVSPVYSFDKTQPSILGLLLYWAQTALGETGFSGKVKDVSSASAIFPDNPARRVSVTGKTPRAPRDPRGVKTGNESDIEESDAEDAA